MILNFHTHNSDKEDGVIKFYNVDLRGGSDEFSKGDFRCAGVHPWWIDEFLPIDKEKIRSYLLNENILCLGEIGLDRSFKKVDFNTQVNFFNFQLELAMERNDKFIIIHCVRAYQEILNSVRDIGYHGNLIFHDYNGNEEITKLLLNQGAYFSYGNLLFHKNSKAMKSLEIIPKNRLFIETDDQDRFSLIDAYKEAAISIGVSSKVLMKQCMENFTILLNN